MRGRAFVVLACSVLVVVVGFLARGFRADAAERERTAREADLALAAKLAELSKKVDRLERSLTAARAETLAACSRSQAAATPNVAVEAAPLPAVTQEPADDAAATARFDEATRGVDDAIARGHWLVADGDRFEATLRSLDGDLRQQALAHLSQALNTARLAPEQGAFPF